VAGGPPPPPPPPPPRSLCCSGWSRPTGEVRHQTCGCKAATPALRLLPSRHSPDDIEPACVGDPVRGRWVLTAHLRGAMLWALVMYSRNMAFRAVQRTKASQMMARCKASATRQRRGDERGSRLGGGPVTRLLRAACRQWGQQHGTCLSGGRRAVCGADGDHAGCQERAAAHQALQATQEDRDGGGGVGCPSGASGRRCALTKLCGVHGARPMFGYSPQPAAAGGSAPPCCAKRSSRAADAAPALAAGAGSSAARRRCYQGAPPPW